MFAYRAVLKGIDAVASDAPMSLDPRQTDCVRPHGGSGRNAQKVESSSR